VIIVGVNKQTRIYETLRGRILAGAYAPGDRLVISAIAAELGVSSVPVREAIRKLEAEGLVLYTHNAGARVAPIEAGEFLDGMSALALLEGYVTALAGPTVDLSPLRASTARMRGCMERLDLAGYARADREFHAAVHEACPNPHMRHLIRDISERLYTIRGTAFQRLPYRGLAAIEEHERLIELLASGAAFEVVETAARQHKLATAEALRQAL